MNNEILLYRIIDAKLPYEGSYICDPSFFVKRKGKQAYEDCIKFIDEDILQELDMKMLLMKIGKWSSADDRKIKDLPLQINNCKIEYYKHFDNPEIKVRYLNQINFLQKQHLELVKRYNSFYGYTLEGIASTAMWVAMIEYMYSGQHKLQALNYYHNNHIDESAIRDLALSEEWVSYSVLSKNPLGKKIIKLTDYQKKLYSWSNIYRNIRNHPEFPGDSIMRDHNAFDGWMAFEDKKSKMDKSDRVNQKKLKPNTKNVFVRPKDINDYHDIMSLNSKEALDEISKGLKK